MTEAAREAVGGDIVAITGLLEEALAGLEDQRGGELYRRREARRPPYAESFTVTLDAEDEVLVVGTIDGVILGWGALRLEVLADGGRLGRVTELYVTPEARGVSVGAAMMDLLVEHATHQGCFGVDSTALPGDRATKNFFESYGLVARAIMVHRLLAPA